jgi:hypothetical protein
MLWSRGQGVVPSLRRAGGDVAGSAWRQGASTPHGDAEPVGMFAGPVGFACRSALAAVELSAHRCVSASSSRRRTLAAKAFASSEGRSRGVGGVAMEPRERYVAVDVHNH